jgi:hypothetical protein
MSVCGIFTRARTNGGFCQLGVATHQVLATTSAALRNELDNACTTGIDRESGRMPLLVARFAWAHRAAGLSVDQMLTALHTTITEAAEKRGLAFSAASLKNAVEWAMVAYLDTGLASRRSLLP